jgi:tRNA pseudouridine55 synthase
MLSGILNLDKPRGMTSHDVVQAVRKSIGLRRVGHTGTLDPNASGVMLICLGRATKFAQFFEGLEKTYWTVMRLGVCTDTQDATGTVTQQCEVPALQVNQVQAVLSRFTGVVQQMPPMYSAVKYRGQRLYRLARQGQVVPRQPRGVRVRRLELLERRGPLLTLGVTCSKGTYIRTLCEDIGLALGCGAHMVQLQRCRVGMFSLTQANSLERLRRQARGVAPGRWCLPLPEALSFLPPLFLTACQYRAVQSGRKGALPAWLATLAARPLVASSYRLCTQGDQTVGVLHRQTSDPEKWKVYHLA